MHAQYSTTQCTRGTCVHVEHATVVAEDVARRSKERWDASNAGSGGTAADLSLHQPLAASDEALLLAQDDSIAVYNYTRVRQSFGFCVDDFRPECFW